jgi:hypothetical protein
VQTLGAGVGYGAPAGLAPTTCGEGDGARDAQLVVVGLGAPAGQRNRDRIGTINFGGPSGAGPHLKLTVLTRRITYTNADVHH